jgi:lysophospholipase L1-like esterase
MMRMDALCVSGDGKVSLIKGVADKAMPAPPKVPVGSATIAHVYLPHGCERIEARQVLPAGKPFPELDAAEIKQRGAQFVPKTLAKLQAGKPVTVVTWGDSVTAGGDASRPELRFADQFAIRLRERYPKADVRHVNAGIGATNTVMRMPKLQEEVLAHKPDLVTIEFVNDMMLKEEIVRQNWNSAIDQITSAGAEVIILTPHFVMPEMMGKNEPFGGETRPFIDWLRDVAAKRNVALADTSKRWEHLEAEGIPYITMLANGINHPDDRGHELFVKDLMSFFPPAE